MIYNLARAKLQLTTHAHKILLHSQLLLLLLLLKLHHYLRCPVDALVAYLYHMRVETV